MQSDFPGGIGDPHLEQNISNHNHAVVVILPLSIMDDTSFRERVTDFFVCVSIVVRATKFESVLVYLRAYPKGGGGKESSNQEIITPNCQVDLLRPLQFLPNPCVIKYLSS